MIRTASLLILTLIVIPIITIWFDTPPDAVQWQMIISTGTLMLSAALGCFILSEITRNCSQFDKLWSILPVVYAWMIASIGEWNDRLVLMAILATVWGVRLTFNFARRGGYSWKFWEGEEDYRWEVLRQRKEFQSKTVWTLFNFFFISLYQNALVWMFTLPPIIAWQARDTSLGIADFIFSGLFVGLVVIETIADQQQYDFQTEKYRKKAAGEALNEEEKQGFISSGLWKISRHPNYAAEQSLWVVFYLMAAFAAGRYLNWSAAGSLLLILLFQGSSNFSEDISSGKYPAYKDYIRKVPRFIPRFF